MLGEQRDGSPGRHQDSDDHEKGNPTRPIFGVFHPRRSLSLTMPPPGEAVADEESETETDDQLREQVLEVEDVAHSRSR
jgi:hypothetical protein